MVNNILVIGITGNGKSALANLLADTEEFGASSLSTSATTVSRKSKPFEWQGKKYQAIDNIGFGDTNNIAEEDILLRIGEGIHSAKEGINQVLFVFKGRFGSEQVEAFNRFKKFISESNITKFTTLVRTNFPSFRDEEACKEDQQSLLDEDNKDLREAIKSCNGIIYVDNPPIPEIDEEDADSGDEKEISEIKKKRKESRKKVLDHLAEKCLEIYPFGEWNNIYQIVDNYINKREEIKQSSSLTKEEELKEIETKVTKEIKSRLAKELPMAAIEYSMKK